MYTADNLLKIIEEDKLDIIEIPFKGNIKGLYCDNTIGISTKIDTSAEKNCVLAEELGHYKTTSGNILCQQSINNIKVESKARRWAVDELIKMEDFIRAFETGIRNRYELAEYLEVTEDFIDFALDHFRKRHGEFYNIRDYTIFFNPLGVLKNLNI